MTSSWILILMGLFLGTYLVRATPFWWDGLKRAPPKIQWILEIIPAAALGALIFPDVMLGGRSAIALGVVGVSFVLSLRGAPLTIVVLISVLGAWAALGFG